VGRGCPPLHRGRSLGRGHCPLPRIFFGYFNVEIPYFRGILVLTVKFLQFIHQLCTSNVIVKHASCISLCIVMSLMVRASYLSLDSGFTLAFFATARL